MKSTTLIAFIMTTMCAAAEIPFDGEMTNSLGWTWNDRIKSNGNGYYIGGQGAVIRSPEFDETVIGLTLKFHRSASCTRDVYFMPGDVRFDLDYYDDSVSVRWLTEENVHQFEIRSDTGSQMLYLLSIEVTTIRQPDAPADFSLLAISTTNATLRWNTAAPKVRLALDTVETTPESFDERYHYEFTGLTNETSRIKAVGKSFWTLHPDLGGDRVYLPSFSTNEIQLSTSDDIGYLSCDCRWNLRYATLIPQVRRHESKGESTVMNIAWALDGETNDFASVSLEKHYTSPMVSLYDVPAGATLIFNSSGNRGNHRVLFKTIDIYTALAPAETHTNCIQKISSIASPYLLTDLEPGTWYRCRLVAVSEDDVESPPAVIEFVTPRIGYRPFVMTLH